MRASHEAEFAEFFDVASPRLLSAAWLLTGEQHAAEDLVQEALARTYARWTRVRSGQPLAYARRVMANLHTDTWRKQRREVVTDHLPEHGGEPAPAGLGFGFGRRVCPGKHLAEASLWIVVANVLALFDIEPIKDKQGRELVPEARFTTALTSHPEPFQCRIKPRSEKSERLIMHL